MVSRQHRLFQLLTLFLVLSLLLVACERPIPGSDEPDEETTTETTDETTGETEEETAAETSEEPETVTDTGETAATTEEEITVEESADTSTGESSEDSTPRVDTEEEVDESESEKETAPESTAETTEEVAEEATEKVNDETESEEAAAETSSEAAADDKVDKEAAPSTHTVAPGENLYQIALKYNISWVTLAEFNGLDNANRIVVGQVLNIPGEQTTAQPEPTPSPLTETTYTVKAGDNLFRIGMSYGISWIQIAEANGLVNPNQVIVGQVLKIPVDTPGPTPQFTHQVKAGETLFLLSLQYGVPWPTIAEANDIGSPYVIYTGQTLVIPGG